MGNAPGLCFTTFPHTGKSRPPNRRSAEILLAKMGSNMKVLPFRISVALWLLTRITGKVMAYLHSRAIEFNICLDDVLMPDVDRRILCAQIAFILAILRGLGFIPNLEKSSPLKRDGTKYGPGYMVREKRTATADGFVNGV